MGYLLREPEGSIWYDESEDEFKCANLDVTVSKDHLLEKAKGMPVLFWVHGGSQIISYGNGASKVGDVYKIVRDSIGYEKPIIVVSVQYRLNMFHFGDGKSNKNLGLKDLQCAMEWVREHIAGFGGDPNNITLAGESAGANLAHAMIVAGAQAKRAILMSGSLYMSPPQPEARAQAAIIEPIMQRLKRRGYWEMKTAPVAELLEVQTDIPIKSVFLQAEHQLSEWFIKTGKIQELIIGDCEFESALFRNGMEDAGSRHILDSFDRAGGSASALKSLYHIIDGRPNSIRYGALDFLNDMLWAMPTWKIAERFRNEGKKVFTYLMDQPNPWQASARAHHAVDLIFLFGGFDLSHNPSALKMSEDLRRRFIEFVNGDEPWDRSLTCAFGPHGQVQEINKDGVRARRRMSHISELKKMPPGDLGAAFAGLAQGRISLHN